MLKHGVAKVKKNKPRRFITYIDPKSMGDKMDKYSGNNSEQLTWNSMSPIRFEYSMIEVDLCDAAIMVNDLKSEGMLKVRMHRDYPCYIHEKA